MNKFIMAASNISLSELKSNRKQFSLSMRMFSTRPNRNGYAVTEAFIDDIIANKDEYVCMPLCADVPKLKRKDYRGLTHMYDKTTGQFLADMIGGFYDFEKVEDEFGISLIGYARINKRSQTVYEAILELYNSNALNFSFEISAGVVNEVDGIYVVDADESNELTAMAIVSVPAYPESKALDLVAEANLDQFYANANMLISEVDIETVRMRFHEALCMVIGEQVYRMCVILFCYDCVVLYDTYDGGVYKAEYMMDGDELIIKDFYEATIVRSEGSEEKMNVNENMVSEQVAEVVDTETTTVEVETEAATEVAAEETTEEVVEAAANIETTEVETVQAETEAVVSAEEDPEEEIPDEEKEDEIEDQNDELEAAKKRCAELEQQVSELNHYKAEVEKAEAEREAAKIKAEKEAFKAFASAQGLNVEDSLIAEAIENLDYKKIVAEAMANKTNVQQQENAGGTYYASFVEIKPAGYTYLLERN